MISLLFKSRCCLSIALAIALGACADTPESTSGDTSPTAASAAAALLEKTITAPGVDLWLGDESAGIDRDPMIDKFPLYAIHHDRFAVSGDQLRPLREQRDAVIAALVPRIETAVNAALAAPGIDTPVASLETELAIALDLNAVELLGLLTGAAMQLQTFLQNFETGKLETYLATPHARLHRNLLGAISGILRQEGFPPIVNEEWESEFTFEKARGGAGINLLDDSIFADDSAPDILIGGRAPFTTRFSQRLMDWSRQYLDQTPEQQRKGSAGIEIPVPALR